MTIQETTPTTEEQLDAARAELAKLEELANDAEAEAQRWATTFEREPSEEAFTKQAITKQRAKNIREEAQAFQRGPLNDLLAQQANAEREIAQAELDKELNAIMEKFDRTGRLLADALREMDGSLNELTRFERVRTELGQKGARAARISIESVLLQLSERHCREFRGNQLNQHLTNFSMVLSDYGNEAAVSISVNRQVPRQVPRSYR